ncbi:DUF3761 domain-containing protein [Kitasatospora sp. NPDC051914]|uniref:DUF3761 domain-containing protein n=1 Tax=Kitasatospora sp. NPDC051914 TaxID=3154945 RepID=UPI0034425954
MTLSFGGRRLLPAAGLLALALFSAACDPAATAAPPPARAASTAAATSPTPTATASAEPAPTPSAVQSSTEAPSPAPARTTAAPARTTSRPAAAPTTAAGHCARHTTGACGWDAGLRPISSSQMAECKDGTPSYSANFSGTCSGHGGVRYWFK